MTSTALVPTVVEMPMDFTVVATSPEEMQKAQRSLILWSARKIQAIKGELTEAQVVNFFVAWWLDTRTL